MTPQELAASFAYQERVNAAIRKDPSLAAPGQFLPGMEQPTGTSIHMTDQVNPDGSVKAKQVNLAPKSQMAEMASSFVLKPKTLPSERKPKELTPDELEKQIMGDMANWGTAVPTVNHAAEAASEAEDWEVNQ
jgi:hypothetical protein